MTHELTASRESGGLEHGDTVPDAGPAPVFDDPADSDAPPLDEED